MERVVFDDRYRWFVRALSLAVALVAVIHLVRYATDALALSRGATQVLGLVTSTLVTVFVLAGAVQLLLYARGIRQRETVVAASAEGVEKSAEDVKEAARRLESAVDDPESGDGPPADVADRVDEAEAKATEAQETVEDVKRDLNPPADDERN